MYAREVDGRTLTLAVSGLLWEGSLVMVDKETGSYWSHLLGEAMAGELQGARLQHIPSVMTDWKSWRTRYPHTTAVVMERTARQYTRQLHQKGYGLALGLARGKKSRAWRLRDLGRERVVNEEFAGRPVVVVYDAESGTAALYGRTVEGRTLTFDWHSGRLRDRESGSRWDPVTGSAVDGPLRGRRLPQEPATMTTERAWKSFHPESTWWAASKRQVGM